MMLTPHFVLPDHPYRNEQCEIEPGWTGETSYLLIDRVVQG
jgi:hypothetical protein